MGKKKQSENQKHHLSPLDQENQRNGQNRSAHRNKIEVRLISPEGEKRDQGRKPNEKNNQK